MKILKYKYLNGNKYKISLENNEIILYEDVIVKYGILLKNELTSSEIDKFLYENTYYDLYYDALNFIKIRLRSKKEVYEYLRKKMFDDKMIFKVMNKIETEGYLNDTVFARSYIHDAMAFKSDGPYKIKNELEKLEVDSSVIDHELKVFSKEIMEEKIKKYVDKQVKLNKNKPFYVLKEKIINYLINLGYERMMIIAYLDTISFDDDDIRKQEYDKLYKKLSLKYEGKELEYKIKQKMYAKGFRY